MTKHLSLCDIKFFYEKNILPSSFSYRCFSTKKLYKAAGPVHAGPNECERIQWRRAGDATR